MNDRELLEMAAKAAGYDVKFVIGAHVAKKDKDNLNLGMFLLDKGTSNQRSWNPIWSDGDALRLAVKLGITVSTGSQTSRFVLAVGDAGEVMEERRADPYAATRRAIVRAAAEIGKAIP